MIFLSLLQLFLRLPAETMALVSLNSNSNSNSNQHNHPYPTTRRLTLDNGKEIPIRSRLVPLTSSWNVTIWELDQPADIMSHYWSVSQQTQQQTLDPFGLVLWPGSVVAAQTMLQLQARLKGKTILIVGAGPGVEAQAAAMLGAKSVLATDIHPTTLQLLRYGAQQTGLDKIIHEQVFDLCSETPLPDCDILVVADVLYSEKLARHVGKRCLEALHRGNCIMVADSQRLADFVPQINTHLNKPLTWKEQTLEAFTGSGVMINEDQTYDIKTRVLTAGEW